MNYRRKTNPRSFQLLFALGLLILGVVLPFASAVLAPAAPGMAAALPTAQLRMPTPRPAVVALAQANTSDQPPATDSPPALPTANPELTAPATDAAPNAAAPTPQAEPTPTITPVQLAPVNGGVAEPIATLFPTVAVPANALVEPQIPGLPPPILMYHYIRTVDQGSDPLGYELSVTPEDFNSQMNWLHEQGYIGMRMD